ncbi:MAG: VOC family protein [Balneolaceae bacterium]|jgi:catechol 2,3-dioxygenase-like lactoylglutathione lyase family enzyme
MHFNRIIETCLYVQNLNKTEAFYNGKLEFPIIGKKEGRHIFFRAGSSVLLCFNAEITQKEDTLPAHFGEGHIHLAFEVPKGQYEKAKEWVQSKDIEIEHEQCWHDDYRSFYFRDPDGHSLEVVPQGLWD